MTQDRISLAAHLDDLISLAALAWQLPEKHYAKMVRTLREIDKLYQVAAVAQREELRSLHRHGSR